MRIALVIFILFFAILAINLSTLVLAQTNDTVSVNITIQAISQITVLPDSLNWTNLQPGSVGGVINMTIRNTGSLNLTNIYAYMNTNETEPIRPYGSSNPANYSSGSLLVIKNSTDNRYYWAQRKEWNWSVSIPNIVLSAFDANSRAAYGFLKNTTFEYVWALGNGTGLTGQNCNTTGTLFGISDQIDVGTSATRTPDTTSISRDGGDSQYSFFSVNRATAPIYNMCVAVNYDCKYILIYRYDRRSGFQTCANSINLRQLDLAPGFSDSMYADAWVPYGIPNGQLAIATMTVVAT